MGGMLYFCLVEKEIMKFYGRGINDYGMILVFYIKYQKEIQSK
jgi:hypothetical protein